MISVLMLVLFAVQSAALAAVTLMLLFTVLWPMVCDIRRNERDLRAAESRRATLIRELGPR